MKRYRNIAIGLLITMVIVVGGSCLFYKLMLEPTNKESIEVEVVVSKGSSISSIATVLKEKDLIKSANVFKLYAKLNKKQNIKSATYVLNKNMGVEKILSKLIQGTSYNPDEIKITFVEGNNIRKIATVIKKNTNNSYDSVFELLKDENYINELINKYWFLTDEIKDKNIYYPLEGYLFPETYIFNNKDVTVKEIFNRMIAEFDTKISKYKADIEELDFSVHEFITLASVVELEGAGSNDRSGIAEVFYNRLAIDMALGSDVTTYYAIKSDNYKKDLTDKQLNDCSNKYNTRCTKNKGLPVGPISNPGIDSIESTLYPKTHTYYYFIADKNKKTYFTSTYSEHIQKKNELKAKDLWIEYEG